MNIISYAGGRAHILAMTSFGRAKLENGLHIPLLGCMLPSLSLIALSFHNFLDNFTVGTYKLKDAATLSSVVDAALASGYRLIGRLNILQAASSA